MSDEEMKRQMEFIIEHQAKFASEIDVLGEDMKRLTDASLGLVNIVGHLTEVQIRTDTRADLFAQNLERLAEAQIQTEQRLNIFINVVERYISGNGGAESPA